MTRSLTDTLAQLVAIDSTSSKSNAPMVALLGVRLEAAGFTLTRQRYADEAGVEKENLLAVRGEGLAELALVGHTDCVPFDPAWGEALTLREEGGRLYGRGSCDTKGFIACALHAAEAAGALRRPLMLVFTADEEVGCFGAKRLVEANLGRARYAIVGEPTSLTPIRANKGYCLAEVELEGREGHSAYPESGASAIFRAARFLTRLEALSSGALRAERDPAFEPPFTTVNVGLIRGGKAKNVIPGRCSFSVEWRPIPGQRVEHVLELLESIVAELAAAEPGLVARVKPSRLDRGVDTDERSKVVQFLVQQSGRAPATVAFGTEAPQLTQLGAEAVVFGPGNIQVAHRTGEFVPKDELLRCEQILGAAIAHFC